MLSIILYAAVPLLFLCFWFIPKGNLLYELLRLPIYWYGVSQVDTSQMKVTKHRYGTQRRQYFYFCQPLNQPSTKKNVVVYFHGGGWAFGAPWQFMANAKQLVHQGYCVFMPSYRRIPMYSFYDLRADITNTLIHIKKLLQANQLEDKKFIFGGISAGGNLAALLSFDKKELKKAGVSSQRISGAFFSGAPLDLNKMQWSIPLYLYAGNQNSDKFKAANPISFLQKNQEKIPVLIIHGTKDGIVEYENARYFSERLSQIQANMTQLYTIENGIHVDSTRWSYEDEDLRKTLFAWLKKLED